MIGAALMPSTATRCPYFRPSVVIGSAVAASSTAMRSGTIVEHALALVHDEVLVLELDRHLPSGAVAGALDHDLAERPAALGLAQQVDRLAFEQDAAVLVVLRAAQELEQRCERIAAAAARLAHRAAELERKRHGAAHQRALGIAAVHRIEADVRRAAHRDHHAAAEALDLDGAVGVDHHRVAVLVGHDHGAGRHAADVVGRHLQLRERAAHAVAVHQGKAAARGEHERQQRIDAADLGAHDRLRFLADVALEGAQRLDHLGAVRHLFHDHGRRAHHAEGRHEGLVVERLDVDQLDRAVVHDGLPQHQRAEVRVPAAAGAEDRGAAREVVDVFEVDAQAHAARPRTRSPIAFTRTRTAPPGR